MTQAKAEKWLKLLLQISGVVLLCALFAMPMPTDWMAEVHRRLFPDELPRGPIVEYLTRTISCLYAAFGAAQILLATDVRRYRPLIVYSGWLHLFAAVAFLPIDLLAPMPLYWTLLEAPTLAPLGVLTLWLVSYVPRT